jgi:hypothetical protein
VAKTQKRKTPPINHFFHKQISKNRLGFIQPPNMKPTQKKKKKSKKKNRCSCDHLLQQQLLEMEKTKREIFTKEKKSSSHKEKGPSGTHSQQGM